MIGTPRMPLNGVCIGNGSTRMRQTLALWVLVDSAMTVSTTNDHFQSLSSLSISSQNFFCDVLQEQPFHQSWFIIDIAHRSHSPMTHVGSYHNGSLLLGVKQCVWYHTGFLLIMQIILRFSSVYIKIFTRGACKLQFAICKFCKFKFTKDLLRLQRTTRFLAILCICLQ